MGGMQYEEARRLLIAQLEEAGYFRENSHPEIDIHKKDNPRDPSVSINLVLKTPPELYTLIEALTKNCGEITSHAVNGAVKFHNCDPQLNVWYWRGTNRCLEIERKGDLTQNDIALIVSLYTALKTAPPKPPAKKDQEDDSNDSKKEGTLEERLTEAGAIVYSPLKLDFDVLAGYQSLKAEIQETILLRMKHPEVYERIVKATRRREETPTAQTVLFEGPPGTGKTTMGRIIASQVNCPFVYLPFEQIRSKYYGESEKNFGEVFDLCAKYPQAILFLDEIDTFASSRSGNSDNEVSARMLGVLLRKMDGFAENRNVLVIGTTNRPEDLDGALKSRFKRKVYFPLPNCVERAWIFESYAKQLDLEQVASLAQITDGFSGRDILNACQATEERWARNIIEGKAKEPAPSFEAYKATLEKRVEKKKDRFGF